MDLSFIEPYGKEPYGKECKKYNFIKKDFPRIYLFCCSLTVAKARITPISNKLIIDKNKIIKMASTISQIYDDVPEIYLIEAINNGSMGKYGLATILNEETVASWWEMYKLNYGNDFNKGFKL